MPQETVNRGQNYDGDSPSHLVFLNSGELLRKLAYLRMSQFLAGTHWLNPLRTIHSAPGGLFRKVQGNFRNISMPA
jgi:hypothetical protein